MPAFRNPRAVLILAALTLFFLLPSVAGFYTDWLWFKEVGYEAVFSRRISVSFGVGTAVFLAAFLVLWTNITIALGSLTQPYVMFGATAQGQPVMFNRGQVRRIATVVASLAALVVALPASSQWLSFLEFQQAVPFGERDPIFGRDIGFYVFKLPVYDFARNTVLALVLLSLVMSAGIYILAGAAGLGSRGVSTSYSRARRHLALLTAALFIVMAAGAWISSWRRPWSRPAASSRARPTWTCTRACRSCASPWRCSSPERCSRCSTRSPGPLAAARRGRRCTCHLDRRGALRGGRPAVRGRAQRAGPRDAVHRTQHRRDPGGVRARSRWRSASSPATRSSTRADIDAQRARRSSNVRLWDHRPLLDTFGQIQEIRTYYDFVSVDNDRYMIDGEYRQMMLSARELNSDEPAEPHLDQRAPDLHPRLRPDPRSGQPGDARGTAGAVHQGHAAGLDRRPAA